MQKAVIIEDPQFFLARVRQATKKAGGAKSPDAPFVVYHIELNRKTALLRIRHMMVEPANPLSGVEYVYDLEIPLTKSLPTFLQDVGLVWVDDEHTHPALEFMGAISGKTPSPEKVRYLHSEMEEVITEKIQKEYKNTARWGRDRVLLDIHSDRIIFGYVGMAGSKA